MRHRSLLAVLAVVCLAAFAPAASGNTPQQPRLDPKDWEAPTVVSEDIDADGVNGLYDDDPTGLIPKTPFVQRYSLDQDYWEVWRCGGVSTSMTSILNTLDGATVDYFDDLSGGLYEPVFVAGGTIAGDENCLNGFISGSYSPVGSPEGLLVVNTVTGSGGYASPGTICIDSNPDCGWIGSTFPDNRRYTVLGEAVLAFDSVIAHEIGHTLQWPHSNSGTLDPGGDPYEYDNPLDLMSGNATTNGWTEPDPYATLSYSRFQSGWVEDFDVVIASGGVQTMTLQPHDVAGKQLFVIPTTQQGRFYVFGARVTSTYDPIPSAWQGVEVYEVDHYCDDGAFGGGICPGIFRAHTQQPPSHDDVGHVLQVGESITLEGIAVTVTGATATGYTITADGGSAAAPDAPGTPTAVPGDEQVALSWTAAGDGGSPLLGYEVEVQNREAGGGSLVDLGVTTSTTVTGLSNGTTYRARARASNAEGDGTWSGWSADFTPATVPGVPGTPAVAAGDGWVSASWTAPTTDGDSSISNYELQVNDVTAGSNTYVNVGAEQGETITGLTNGHDYRVRGRAENSVGLGAWSNWSATVTPTAGAEPPPPPPPPPAPPPPSVDTFIDDDESVFETDIEWLAAEDVTKGCNPPVNDMFCPDDAVTRGQMAAFLSRALGLTDRLDDAFGDDDGSVFETDIERLAAAEITLGCNPPANDRFCPNDPVTRGQMAAFLVRALGYTDAGDGDLFTDDDGSIFGDAIDKLATAGVTRGCNPPANDRFCPNDVVTRGQMAAFLHRALG